MQSTAVEQKQEVEQIVFFSHSMSVSFDESGQVASNKNLAEIMAKTPDDAKVSQNGVSTLNVNIADFAFFMHLLFCDTPPEFTLLADFDGINCFEAPDENGDIQKFNAQMIMISYKPA
jgi:hypothetical protein